MVTVITITYNRADLIKKAIQSVLDQTYSDFEYIIVDDGSEDHTAQVVHAFDDARIRYFAIPHCGSLSILRNFGVSKCKGSSIAFLDSDDLWKPNYLEEQQGLLDREPDVGFVICEAEVFTEDQIIVEETYPGRPQMLKSSFFDTMTKGDMLILTPSILFRKECLDKTGPFDEQLRVADNDLHLRLCYHFEGIIHRQHLVRIRKHGGNMYPLGKRDTSGFEEFTFSLLKLKELGFINQSNFRFLSARNYYRKGLFLAHSNLLTASRKAFYQAFKLNPQIKTLGRLVLPKWGLK